MKNAIRVVVIVAISCFIVCSVVTASSDELWSVYCGSGSGSDQVTIETDYCTEVMGFLRLYSRVSTMTLRFKLPEGDFAGYRLKVVDSGTLHKMEAAKQGGAAVWSPVTIKVNNIIVAENIDIKWTMETADYYPVGSYLKPGANMIIFSLAPNSRTRYDIKSVSLLEK